MQLGLYKLRKGRILTGVLAGLAHQIGMESRLLRLLFVCSLFLGPFFLIGSFLYFLLSYMLPYKEDRDAERFGLTPRKIKDAEKR